MVFFSDHVCLCGDNNRHNRDLRSLLGGNVVPRHLVGAPLTEGEFSKQGTRFG